MSSLLSSITGAHIVSWLVTIAVAGFIFWVFRRRQLDTIRSQKEIARHSILRTLEEDIASIFRDKSAQVLLFPESSNEQRAVEPREFRSILDNRPPWSYEPDNAAEQVAGWNPPVSRFIDGQRYWLVRRIKIGTDLSEQQYLASRALQETLLWFRRVAKAHKDQVVYADDLADLWRFVLPFGFSGRLQYFSKYFQGEEDIQAMVSLINETLRCCCDRKWRMPLHYFTSYRTEEDRQILTRDEASRELHRRVEVLGT